jgi:ADP-ribose pyrophosphatase YjhB (NUDIX family)
VGVVVWRDNRFLLVRRGREPNRGQWSIPGGAQHLGETVYQAAEREVLEETGLGIRVLGLVDVVDGIRRDGEGRVSWHYTLVDLVAESLEGDPCAGDDAEAVAWFTLDDLPGLDLWRETERIIRQSVALREAGSAPRPPDSPL